MNQERIRAMQEGRRKRPAESSEDYPIIVAGPVGDDRIIRCADDIQYILQRRTSIHGKPYWASKWFFHRREGAERLPCSALWYAAVALFDAEKKAADSPLAEFTIQETAAA